MIVITNNYVLIQLTVDMVITVNERFELQQQISAAIATSPLM